MSLRRTIQSAVNKAFNAVGDLKKSGTLQGNSSLSYNLATGSNVEIGGIPIAVDVIIDLKTRSDDSSSVYKAIIKSGVNIDVYKTIEIDSVVYRINSYDDDEFIINLELVREE